MTFPGGPVRRFRFALLITFAIAGFSAHAAAWSHKEHMQVTRLAVMRLLADPQTPPQMKDWLRRASVELLDLEAERQFLLRARVGPYPRGADGLAHWATVPDLLAEAGRGPVERKVEPFGVHERLLHYLDVEFFAPGANADKPVYADDLSQKPRLEDFPRDMKDPRYAKAGMLPFRVEDCYQRLVASIRQDRLIDRPGQFPRDEHATRWAGMLAHYLADSTQPHHATVDFRSASYFPGVERAPNVHADMEYRLVDDDHNDYPELRREFWDLLVKALEQTRDPIQTADVWQATIETMLISYDALPMIGRAAQAAYLTDDGGIGAFQAEAFFHHKGRYRAGEMSVLEMKAHQLAWAVKRIETVWRQAWDEAMRQQAD
jgi:hypothetical protein